MEQKTRSNDMEFGATPSTEPYKLDCTTPASSLIPAVGPSHERTQHEYPLTEDPMTFVDTYSAYHNLPSEPGCTPVEQSCQSRAAAARDEYKRLLRHMEASLPPSGSSSTTQRERLQRGRTTLSWAEKYARRLKNNRRSAHAAKVYAEILRREISAVLCRLSDEEKSGCTGCCEDTQNKRLQEEENEIIQLRARVAQLAAQRDHLEKELQETDRARVEAEQLASEARNSMHQSVRQYWGNGEVGGDR